MKTNYVKEILLIIIIGAFFTGTVCSQGIQEKSSGKQPVRPQNWVQVKYKYSIEQLRDLYSESLMKKAQADVGTIQEVNEKGKWKPTWESLNNHAIPDWIGDAKFGIFFDWGPWSVAGYATRKGSHYYPDWYEFRMRTDTAVIAYHNKFWGKDFRPDDLLPLMTGKDFDAEKYVRLAKECGARYFVPFARHHAGWTLWDSKYTFRNAVEMGPHRDIYKEIADACRAHGLKLGLYTSLAEWLYPIIMPDGTLGVCDWGVYKPGFDSEKMNGICSGKIPVKNFVTDYLLPLTKEAIDKYDPDILWYDGEWLLKAEYWRSLDMAAYFFNKAEGRKTVVLNDRLGEKIRRTKDFTLWSSEYHEISKPTRHIWEELRSISQSYGYHWQDTEDNILSAPELVKLLVNTVANNGNLILILNPTGSGFLPEIQEKRLRELGAWLKVNGEAIYSTRPWNQSRDGDQYFTQSKDARFVYITCMLWPGQTLKVNSLTPKAGSKITLLGTSTQMAWNQDGQNISIKIPAALQDETKRPCKYGWVFKVQIK
jgi:alpha-L-fucosidase